MIRLFTPGCGLMLYKPHLAERLHELLVENFGRLKMSLTCCRHIPPLISGTQVINICPGCDRRYRENYEDSGTISLWEALIESPFVPLPDYAADEVLVYCVSCAKSMFIGGKRPHYLIDLLFNEETIPKTLDPDLWHQELDAFIESHT